MVKVIHVEEKSSPDTVHVAFKAPHELAAQLDERAKREGRTRSNLIIRLLTKVLGKKTK